MSSIRVLIVEDELIYSELLRAHLLELGYEPLGPAPTAGEAETLFRQHTPDLVLLDISLRGGTDGIELARQLRMLHPTPLIFITAFADRNTFERARQVGPFAYITKPFDGAAVQRAVELALQSFGQPAAGADDEEEADEGLEWSADLLLRDAFFVKERGQLIKIRQEEVLWIEAGDKYCTLVLSNHHKVPLRMSLKELARELSPQRFVQVHRSYVINVHQLERLDPGDHLVYVAGHELPLGRSYKEPLLRRLQLLGSAES